MLLYCKGGGKGRDHWGRKQPNQHQHDGAEGSNEGVSLSQQVGLYSVRGPMLTDKDQRKGPDCRATRSSFTWQQKHTGEGR